MCVNDRNWKTESNEVLLPWTTRESRAVSGRVEGKNHLGGLENRAEQSRSRKEGTRGDAKELGRARSDTWMNDLGNQCSQIAVAAATQLACR